MSSKKEKLKLAIAVCNDYKSQDSFNEYILIDIAKEYGIKTADLEKELIIKQKEEKK